MADLPNGSAFPHEASDDDLTDIQDNGLILGNKTVNNKSLESRSHSNGSEERMGDETTDNGGARLGVTVGSERGNEKKVNKEADLTTPNEDGNNRDNAATITGVESESPQLHCTEDKKQKFASDVQSNKLEYQDTQASLSNSRKENLEDEIVQNAVKGVQILTGKSAPEISHRHNGEISPRNKANKNGQSNISSADEGDLDLKTNAALAEKLSSDIQQAKSECEQGGGIECTVEVSTVDVSKAEKLGSSGNEKGEGTLNNAFVVDNGHNSLEGAKTLSDPSPGKSNVELLADSLQVESAVNTLANSSRDKSKIESLLDKLQVESDVETLANTLQDKSKTESLLDNSLVESDVETLANTSQDKSKTESLSDKLQDGPDIEILANTSQDKSKAESLSDKSQDGPDIEILANTSQDKSKAESLSDKSQGEPEDAKNLPGAPLVISKHASEEKTIGVASGTGPDNSDVIHVLTSDEEEDQLASVVVTTSDSPKLVQHSIHFSDIQCNLRKQLDGKMSPLGPYVHVTKSSRSAAAQADKEVCYGDGTFCVECGKVFALQSYFSDHIGSHYAGALTCLGQCALCGLVFTNSFSRSEHLVSACERMETAMKIIKWNGLFNEKKESKSSKWVTIESDDDASSHSGESSTPTASGIEQAAAKSPQQASEKQNLEVPDGVKRKRKATEKFAPDPSPTFKRRKLANGKGKTGKQRAEVDPEVEAYLMGLVKEGLTVDPAALSRVIPKSAPLAAKLPSLNYENMIRGFHDSRNTVALNKNGGVCITLGNPSQGRAGASPVLAAALSSTTALQNPTRTTSIPLNQNVCFMRQRVPGDAIAFSPSQTSMGRPRPAAVSLLPNGARHLLKTATPGVLVPNLAKPASLSVNRDHSYLSLQLKNSPRQATNPCSVVMTALAVWPRIKDTRIERLIRRRLGRKDSQGCKRIRNVSVKLRRLVVPPVPKGEWPIWRLNSAHLQPQTVLPASRQTAKFKTSASQQQRYNFSPLDSQTLQSVFRRDDHSIRRLSRSNRNSVPIVKLNKLPVVSTRTSSDVSLKNRTRSSTSPKLSSFPPRPPVATSSTLLNVKNGTCASNSPKLSSFPRTPPVATTSTSLNVNVKNRTCASNSPKLPGFQSTQPVIVQVSNSLYQRTKEQSRNAVEAMLQSISNPSVSFHKPNIVRHKYPMVSSGNNILCSGNSVLRPLPAGNPTPGHNVVRTVLLNHGFKRVEISSNVSNSSEEAIVIDDDDGEEKEEEKADAGRQNKVNSLKPQTPHRLKQPTLSKNTVVVREIGSSEPSVIVDISKTPCSTAVSKRTWPTQPEDKCEEEDNHTVSKGKAGEECNSVEGEQDICGWKVQVVDGPDDSEDENKDDLSSNGSKIQRNVSLSKSDDETGSKSEGNNDAEKIKVSEPGDTKTDAAHRSEKTKTSSLLHPKPQVCQTLNQSKVVSIPAHLENSSNIQDIFSEIEKTCREMQENAENSPQVEQDSKGSSLVEER